MDDTNLVLKVAFDVTDRKKAEDALRESEAFHRSLFEDSPTPLFLQDFQGVMIRLRELKEQGVGDLKEYLNTHPEETARLARLVSVTRVNQAAVLVYQAGSPQDLLGRPRPGAFAGST